MATKFSEFSSVGNLRITDIIVGLRSGTNSQYTFSGIIENSNGATIFKMVSPGDLAANYPQLSASLTGSQIIFEPEGSDASAGMLIRTKLDGDFDFTLPGNGDVDFNFNGTGNFNITNTGGGLFTLNGTTGITGVLDEDTMVSDSATHVSTQQATKAYVDTSITAVSAFTYVTNTDETTDLPNSQSLSALSTGFGTVTTTTGIVGSRVLTGTANEVDISNGDGTVGNPVWSLSSTLVFPGTSTLGGNLDVTGHSIVTTSDGDITLVPNGLGKTNLTETLIDFTATTNDTYALEIDCHTANFADIKAVDVFYDAGTLSGTQDEGVSLINIDESSTTGGEIFAFQILSTQEGSASIYGTFHGINVSPLLQFSGTFIDATSLDDNGADVTVALSGGGAGNVSVFENDNETFTIGDAATFESIEFIVDTGASGAGIAPTWEYSTGAATWATFSPVDGTNGFRNTGEAVWLTVDLAGWATSGGEYLIRITRTRNSLSTTPILDLVQISNPTEYSWDKDGVVTAAEFNVAGDIVHIGDTDNKIAFGTDTQDFQTGSSSRLDISDSGVRLGAANARVTTVLDEDDMSTDSATALATQQSIKAYIDSRQRMETKRINNPTSSEDDVFFFTDVAITVTQLSGIVRGTTPSVTYTIRFDADRSATGTEVVTGGTITASETTGVIVTSFNDATIPADNWVWLETTAESGTTLEMAVTLKYTID